MSPEIGTVRHFAKLTPEQKKVFVPLSAEEFEEIRFMSRSKRREWARMKGLIEHPLTKQIGREEIEAKGEA